MSAAGDDGIDCPHCGRRIALGETFRKQVESQVRRDLDERVREEVARAEAAARAEAGAKAREEVGVELKDARSALAEREKQLGEARTKELDLRRRERALEDQKKELELSVERRLGEERKAIEDSATKAAHEALRLKEQEKDKVIGDLRAQLENASRTAAQGSQQLQGEVLELELERALGAAFPLDEILPVAKGVRGADVLQRIRTAAGRPAGALLWETKNAKHWSDGWLGKLREDQAEAKADIAVLVTEALPEGIETFGFREGIWVTGRSFFLPVAAVLRAGLVEVAGARDAGAHKDERMEILFRYLTGPEFRQRLLAVVESYKELGEELDREQRSTTRRWATQRKLIDRAIGGIAGMNGDLRGLAGPAMPSLPLLENPTPPEGEPPAA